MVRYLHSCFVSFATILIATAAGAQPAGPQSRPEQTNYEETSRYDDVVKFFQELQRTTPLVRYQSFGKTHEGREMPLVIVANPPVATPRDALGSGKPIVFVMANIHAGEVEGKESVQHIARRMTSGDLRPLTDQVVLLIAPIYNADGNERVTPAGRSRQNGPIGEVGQRANALGMDLNRDYTKLEAPETRALVRLFNEWDPDITVDLHTTNGSYHAYHLTYSIPLNPSIDPLLATYHREKMMPAIDKAMLDKHKWRTYYYGNFSNDGGPRAGGRGGRGGGRGGRRGGRGERGEGRGEATPAEGQRVDRGGAAVPAATENAASAQPATPPAARPTTPAEGQAGARGAQPQSADAQPAAPAGPPPMRRWVAFSHLPRVGQNYVGMRNRLTILSEAYSYVDFKGRINVTADFVEEIMRYAIEHADEIRSLTRQADNHWIRQAMSETPPRIGVEYEQRPLPEPVEILVGGIESIENPRTGTRMTAMTDQVTPERMLDYGTFAATRSVGIANAYLFPPEERLRVVVDKLRQHGIVVEELTQPLSIEVQAFHITARNDSARPFEGHREVSLSGTFELEKVDFPAGTILVRSAQPLGRLAAYLLEPESDDSLATWNYLDDYLAAGKVYPIKKLVKPVTAASRVVGD
ncbi:MAG: M14 family zinc carboxypeptidase [Pirellulales bacterium]